VNFALIFDVDGVLVDTEPLSMRASNRAFLELHAVEPKDHDHEAFMGATAVAHALGIAKRYGLRINAEQLAERHVDYFIEELSAARGLAFPHAHELIAQLAEQPEWRIGLATSSPRRRSEATLAAGGYPTELFEAWLTGDDISRSKPDPEIYLRAAMALGTPPKRCVVVEDAVAGVAAAKAAGMACVAVTHTFPGEALREADRIVDSLRAIDVTMLYDLVHEAGGD
jgi:HAD superfamily hydrolase (TIGR01509 family)